MSPTVLHAKGFRLFFFSREEPRPHVHVHHASGEAKFWLKPQVELARNSGISESQLRIALRIIQEHLDEIQESWQKHFGR